MHLNMINFVFSSLLLLVSINVSIKYFRYEYLEYLLQDSGHKKMYLRLLRDGRNTTMERSLHLYFFVTDLRSVMRLLLVIKL